MIFFRRDGFCLLASTSTYPNASMPRRLIGMNSNGLWPVKFRKNGRFHSSCATVIYTFLKLNSQTLKIPLDIVPIMF